MNSPIEIHKAKDRTLLIFLSQKIIRIIKDGRIISNIKNGKPKSVKYLKISISLL